MYTFFTVHLKIQQHDLLWHD